MSGTHENHDQSSVEIRTRALEQLLVEKDLLSVEEIDQYIHYVEHEIGPMLGARVVARAWTDPEYKQRLLADGSSAIEELGIDTGGTKVLVVENRAGVHNVVCCTLCSCYPWRILGLPPTWYKSSAYRSRIVIDPRGVLKEFGTTIAPNVELRVWDSNSECRYMVLPERPSLTEDFSAAELAALVTRDSMVGVSFVPQLAKA